MRALEYARRARRPAMRRVYEVAAGIDRDDLSTRRLMNATLSVGAARRVRGGLSVLDETGEPIGIVSYGSIRNVVWKVAR